MNEKKVVNWKGKKREHEWDYMGWDDERKVEYGYCALCGKYRMSRGGLISEAQYLERVKARKVCIDGIYPEVV
jgi:hypothetical protein